jgi:hypothetical protein
MQFKLILVFHLLTYYMKKIILFGFAGLGLLAACKNPFSKKPTNDEVIKKAATMPGVNAGSGNFDIETPAGWVRMDTSMSGLQTTLLLSTVAANGFRSNVNVITQAMSGMAGDAYFDANLAVMSREMEGFKVIEKGAKDINGLPAHFVHYTALNGARTLEQELYIIPSGNIAYLVTCTSLPGRMAKDQATFDQAVSSFKIHQ